MIRISWEDILAPNYVCCLILLEIGTVACPRKLQNSGPLWPHSWTKIGMEMLLKVLESTYVHIYGNGVKVQDSTRQIDQMMTKYLWGRLHVRIFSGRSWPCCWWANSTEGIQICSRLVVLIGILFCQFKVCWSDFEGIGNAFVTFGLKVVLSEEFVLLPKEVRVYGEFEK